jgi:hypothetical protein
MGAIVSAPFDLRWRSGQHIGAAKPNCLVQIRKVRFIRRYAPWPGPSIGARFPGLDGDPWHPTLHSFDGTALDPDDYVTVPGILELSDTQDFESKGTKTMTVTVENIGYSSQMGGLYHLIERGILAPWRGAPPAGAPASFPKSPDWYKRLLPNAQITVWQGYGDEMVKTFTGLINDVDMTSRPDRIVVTTRDFGQVLTDSRLFIQNKDPRIKDPVIFADRRFADDTRQIEGVARASSSHPSHPPRFAADRDKKTSWRSARRPGPNDTEWLQMRVPRGRYESLVVHPEWSNMELYVGVFARPGPGGAHFVDGERIEGEGWVDLDRGDIPGGDDGGWPYLRKVASTKAGEMTIPFRAVLQLGENSLIRVGFRRLHRVSPSRFQAGVVRLAPVRRNVEEEAREKHWVLVDDCADVVRCCLRWAGFKEWDVEETGVRIKRKTTIARDRSLMDIIDQMCELTGFVFFIQEPTDEDASIGIPTFRRNGSITAHNQVAKITDQDLLTGIQVKTSDESLPTIIRVRGKEAPHESADPFGSGRVLGGDRTRRLMAVYRPPWHNIVLQQVVDPELARLASVLRHVNYTRNELNTMEECYEAAYLIALQAALESTTAVAEIPANPKFGLDDQAMLVDRGTGINTRLWIAQRSTSMRLGENAEWKMTLGGSLIDTPDIQAVIAELDAPWQGEAAARQLHL